MEHVRQHENWVTVAEPRGSSHGGENVRMSECQHSQISRVQGVTELAGWIFSRSFFFLLFLKINFFFGWHLSFPSTAKQGNNKKCMLVFFKSFPCSEVRNCYRYFSYDLSQVKVPYSLFEVSKEHRCISVVSVLPATVYVALGVCSMGQ